MGWSIGFDENWNRDIGYGVPAYCDHPDCSAEIDRGLAYVCGGDPYGGEHGCGLFFCGKHLGYMDISGEEETCQGCERCAANLEPFTPKPEHPRWIEHVRTDASWHQWRRQNPKRLAALIAMLPTEVTSNLQANGGTDG